MPCPMRSARRQAVASVTILTLRFDRPALRMADSPKHMDKRAQCRPGLRGDRQTVLEGHAVKLFYCHRRRRIEASTGTTGKRRLCYTLITTAAPGGSSAQKLQHVTLDKHRHFEEGTASARECAGKQKLASVRGAREGRRVRSARAPFRPLVRQGERGEGRGDTQSIVRDRCQESWQVRSNTLGASVET